jgi:hypothetical protein
MRWDGGEHPDPPADDLLALLEDLSPEKHALLGLELKRREGKLTDHVFQM